MRWLRPGRGHRVLTAVTLARPTRATFPVGRRPTAPIRGGRVAGKSHRRCTGSVPIRRSFITSVLAVAFDIHAEHARRVIRTAYTATCHATASTARPDRPTRPGDRRIGRHGCDPPPDRRDFRARRAVLYVPTPRGGAQPILDRLYDAGLPEDAYAVITDGDAATDADLGLKELDDRYVEGPDEGPGLDYRSLR